MPDRFMTLVFLWNISPAYIGMFGRRELMYALPASACWTLSFSLRSDTPFVTSITAQNSCVPIVLRSCSDNFSVLYLVTMPYRFLCKFSRLINIHRLWQVMKNELFKSFAVSLLRCGEERKVYILNC